jgi:hypothetical protein
MHSGALVVVALQGKDEGGGEKDDSEFIQVDRLLYVSRFGPDVSLNSSFRQRRDPHGLPPPLQIVATAHPARLAIGRAEMTDTMYFQQLSSAIEPALAHALPAEYVEIGVKAVSLNAKGVYAINGRVYRYRDGRSSSI